MQSREMNIVEMLMHFVWFACGFVPGALIAQRSGIFPGLMVGFIAFLLILFTVGRVRLAFHRRGGSRSKRS
jgi:hypothetical protein